MLQGTHSKKVSIPVVAPIGSTTLVAAKSDAYIYVHELMGDLTAGGTVEILAGTRSLAKFTLDAGQGLTEQDEPGMDGISRFECRPGEALILAVTGGQFDGALDYSLGY